MRTTDLDGHGAYVTQAVTSKRAKQSGGHAGAEYANLVDPVGARMTDDRGVRRLTPLECERLQGFPDDWTLIPGASDSKRYAAIGDAVTVPVARWIGARLMREETT